MVILRNALVDLENVQILVISARVYEVSCIIEGSSSDESFVSIGGEQTLPSSQVPEPEFSIPASTNHHGNMFFRFAETTDAIAVTR